MGVELKQKYGQLGTRSTPLSRGCCYRRECTEDVNSSFQHGLSGQSCHPFIEVGQREVEMPMGDPNYLPSKSTDCHSAPCSISFKTTDSKTQKTNKQNPTTTDKNKTVRYCHSWILQLKYSAYLCAKGSWHRDKASTEQNTINRTVTENLKRLTWVIRFSYIFYHKNGNNNGYTDILCSFMDRVLVYMHGKTEEEI